MPKSPTHPVPEIVPELAAHLSLILGLYVAADVAAFRDAIFALLHALFPCEFVCLVFQQGAQSCQEVFRDKFPFASPEEYAYFATAIPAVERFWAPPRRKVFRYSDFIAPAEMQRTEYYRRLMQPQNWLYFAGLLVWERQRLVSLASLHRSAADGEFTDNEMSLLAALQPHFHTAAQRLMILHRERVSRLSLERLVQPLPLPTLLLDWNLAVLYHNTAAAEACRRWELGLTAARQRKRGPHFRVPAALLDACRQLQARRQNGHDVPEAAPLILHSPHVPKLRASLTTTKLTQALFAEPAFIVQFDEAPAVERPAEQKLALLRRLTPSERRIVLAVCAGDTSRQIAATLGKSEATVKKQLQSAYRKLDVQRRTQLAALFHESATA